MFSLGIKGWYALASAATVVTSEISPDPITSCVGGIELGVRFAHQDDRRRLINSAKQLGWLDKTYLDEENFLEGNFSFLKIRKFQSFLFF